MLVLYWLYVGLLLDLVCYLFAAITRKTGNNFWGRPIEPEKSYSRFSPILTKAKMELVTKGKPTPPTLN